MTYVDYAFADGAARITLAAGDRGNPINAASVAELHDAVRRAHADAARVIVLASTGRFFSVGGDLAAMAASDDMVAYIDDLAEALHRVAAELVASDAIVVAAVQGPAAGAGFPLAMTADLVVAADHVTFTFAYTKIGLSVDGGSSLLVHSLGLHHALRLALLNDALTAAEAQAAGLLARVVPAAELDATVDEVVGRLLAGAPGGFATTKRLLRTVAEPAPESAMHRETVGIRTNAAGADGREGIAAFLEKRAPRFGGVA